MLGYSRIEIEGRTGPWTSWRNSDSAAYSGISSRSSTPPPTSRENSPSADKEGDDVNVLASATTMYRFRRRGEGVFCALHQHHRPQTHGKPTAASGHARSFDRAGQPDPVHGPAHPGVRTCPAARTTTISRLSSWTWTASKSSTTVLATTWATVVLIEVSRRLEDSVRELDTVSRFRRRRIHRTPGGVAIPAKGRAGGQTHAPPVTPSLQPGRATKFRSRPVWASCSARSRPTACRRSICVFPTWPCTAPKPPDATVSRSSAIACWNTRYSS